MNNRYHDPNDNEYDDEFNTDNELDIGFYWLDEEEGWEEDPFYSDTYQKPTSIQRKVWTYKDSESYRKVKDYFGKNEYQYKDWRSFEMVLLMRDYSYIENIPKCI
jgi:hypothetical protein